MKEQLIRAQTTRSTRISCKGQVASCHGALTPAEDDTIPEAEGRQEIGQMRDEEQRSHFLFLCRIQKLMLYGGNNSVCQRIYDSQQLNGYTETSLDMGAGVELSG